MKESIKWYLTTKGNIMKSGAKQQTAVQKENDLHRRHVRMCSPWRTLLKNISLIEDNVLILLGYSCSRSTNQMKIKTFKLKQYSSKSFVICSKPFSPESGIFI